MKGECTDLFKARLVDKGSNTFARGEFARCVLLLDPVSTPTEFNFGASKSQIGDPFLHCLRFYAFFNPGHLSSTSAAPIRGPLQPKCSRDLGHAALHRIQQSGFNRSVTFAILSA